MRKPLVWSATISRLPADRELRRSAYVYAILVDGVVCYIGKGRNGRLYTHLIEAKRSAAQPSPDTSGLYPRRHRKLVEAVRAGSQITEIVIISDLTDWEAYRIESRMIGEFHRFRAGQLWNTIDERFLDPRYLPEEWDDPEHPLYRLPRPLVSAQSAIRRGGPSSSTRRARPAGGGAISLSSWEPLGEYRPRRVPRITTGSGIWQHHVSRPADRQVPVGVSNGPRIVSQEAS